MTSLTEARELAVTLASKARDGGPADWRGGAAELEALDGRSWLVLDQAARTFTYATGTPVGGVRGWLDPSVGEPTGFVAVVTSMHVDGRLRERATQILATNPAGIAASALAVRLLDHVPQVRAAAWTSLQPQIDADNAAAVLEVLLAGRGRQHAAWAVDQVRQALIAGPGLEDVVRTLRTSSRRNVRRWAHELGHQRDLLTADQLVDTAGNDPDQWLRAACADWLMHVGDPSHIVQLLDAGSVESRLVALTRLPDDRLSDEAIRALLTDRAPRVRELARWRARRRGLDIVGHYRSQLATSPMSPRVLAACLDGIAAVGDESDLPSFIDHLGHRNVRVRAAAVSAILGRASSDEVAGLLAPVLLDPSPRVSATAARSLARSGAPPSLASEAWASERPAHRRAAWQLSRASGGWHRVEADLRAAGDPDAHLASLGEAGIANWLAVGAATTWDHLTDEQRTRIADLLAAAGLDAERARIVAFHAALTGMTS
ncbi:HEAT repeat domain-containing protein [Jiangella mangrovi]|uniref:HEAT repeat protein n=1 Tax=Jiangella mangrovi TaxID=1524084 RepID=A0A7W9LPB7_9ACTN|nr:HEAT repeat domain-containing protein [Jiangella mangrovi]MBB5791141.1 HEAT repeat protein [Jiangella mangrovi]